jgi:hypothetical protein
VVKKHHIPVSAKILYIKLQLKHTNNILQKSAESAGDKTSLSFTQREQRLKAIFSSECSEVKF